LWKSGQYLPAAGTVKIRRVCPAVTTRGKAVLLNTMKLTVKNKNDLSGGMWNSMKNITSAKVKIAFKLKLSSRFSF
jgi:hypothetical protein